jgi:hypothetical protein
MMAQLWHHNGALKKPGYEFGEKHQKSGNPALDYRRNDEETHVL